MRKLFVILLSLLLCFKTIGAVADFYYYRGNKIPLVLNENKLCVCIPKIYNKTSEEIQANAKVLKTIRDEELDIFAIPRTDYEHLISSKIIEEPIPFILTPCYITENGAEIFATPHLNVRLKKEQDISLLTSYAERLGLRILRNSPMMPLWYILTVTPECGKTSVECANELWESGVFAASVPDLCSDYVSSCPNDPLFYQQWGLKNDTNHGIDISACTAWNYSTGKNVKIAILDMGVDMNHIDLSPNIDSLSYDTETSTSPSVVYGSHGTMCAGIAAAVKDNGIHIAGVAPDAKIISISNEFTGTTDNLQKRADGITWAYVNGADIISNSWGAEAPHDGIQEAIQNAFKYGRQGKGCVIVFATGNRREATISFPANCNDTILAVGAIDNEGVRWEFSRYGTGLDLVAPGVDVLTTRPNNSTIITEGTSLACPHVAGVAALILERNSELTVNQVDSIICSNAKKISGINFNTTKPFGSWNNEYGYGLVDAYSSVINTPTDVYIQNDSVTGTRLITAESIHVGRDVTNTKPYGDVVLGPGDITLKAKVIEIKNSTTVPIGTTLTIENKED